MTSPTKEVHTTRGLDDASSTVLQDVREVGAFVGRFLRRR
jgi:hypothetical protein